MEIHAWSCIPVHSINFACIFMHSTACACIYIRMHIHAYWTHAHRIEDIYDSLYINASNVLHCMYIIMHIRAVYCLLMQVHALWCMCMHSYRLCDMGVYIYACACIAGIKCCTAYAFTHVHCATCACMFMQCYACAWRNQQAHHISISDSYRGFRNTRCKNPSRLHMLTCVASHVHTFSCTY